MWQSVDSVKNATDVVLFVTPMSGPALLSASVMSVTMEVTRLIFNRASFDIGTTCSGNFPHIFVPAKISLGVPVFYGHRD